MRVELSLEGMSVSWSESSLEGTKVGSPVSSGSIVASEDEEEDEILRTRLLPRLRLRLRFRRDEDDDLRRNDVDDEDLRRTAKSPPGSLPVLGEVARTVVVAVEGSSPAVLEEGDGEAKKPRATLSVKLAVAEMRMKSVMSVKSSEDFPRISANALSGMRTRRKSRVKGGVRRNIADNTANRR